MSLICNVTDLVLMPLSIFCDKLKKMGSAISVRCIVWELWFGFMPFFIIANIAISAICISHPAISRYRCRNDISPSPSNLSIFKKLRPGTFFYFVSIIKFIRLWEGTIDTISNSNHSLIAHYILKKKQSPVK